MPRLKRTKARLSVVSVVVLTAVVLALVLVSPTSDASARINPLTSIWLEQSANPAPPGVVTYIAFTEFPPAQGTVTFLQSGSPIHGCVNKSLVSGIVAKCHANYTAAGSYDVQAELRSGGGALKATSSAIAETNIPANSSPAPTIATLKAAINPIKGGTDTNVTAKVSPVPDGGTITFQVDGKDLIAVSGPYCDNFGLNPVTGKTQCSVLFVSPRPRQPITAIYSGDANYASSTAFLWETVT
jgi:hypothetical protein